jgi:hypothetical protein
MWDAQALTRKDSALKIWVERYKKAHRDLKQNTDYAISGIFYDLLQFERKRRTENL